MGMTILPWERTSSSKPRLMLSLGQPARSVIVVVKTLEDRVKGLEEKVAVIMRAILRIHKKEGKK